MDNIFFILSKLLWLLIRPENLIIIALFIVFVLSLLKQHKLAQKYLYFIGTAVFIIAILPIGSWLIYPLEAQFPTHPKLPKQVDGIILLGGSFKTGSSLTWNKVQTNQYADRIFDFVSLKHKYPNAKAIFSGGQASINAKYPPEAFYAKKLFRQMGVTGNPIIYESNARNTYENIIFSKQIAKPKQGENWIVISSAFHLPRAIGVFCKQGWSVIPYPADFHTSPDNLFELNFNLSGNLTSLNQAIHEWLGLIAYYLTNKTTHWLPKQCT